MRGDVLVASSVVLCAAVMLGCSAGTDEARGGQRAYPGGDYGTAEGEVAPPGLAWLGSNEREGAARISIGDYFDADGSKGINALLVDQSAAWCGPCQHLAKKLGENMRESWKARGIHVITLLTESPDRGAPTLETADAWKQRFNLEGTAVVDDPGKSFRDTFYEASAPYPYHLIIDPRTMQIVEVSAGFDGKGDFPSVVELAEKNARRP